VDGVLPPVRRGRRHHQNTVEEPDSGRRDQRAGDPEATAVGGGHLAGKAVGRCIGETEITQRGLSNAALQRRPRPVTSCGQIGALVKFPTGGHDVILGHAALQ
jgi:hypothetical protein